MHPGVSLQKQTEPWCFAPGLDRGNARHLANCQGRSVLSRGSVRQRGMTGRSKRVEGSRFAQASRLSS